ncbi:MAG: M57 family metalloprotease [Ferruginibacter sp.]
MKKNLILFISFFVITSCVFGQENAFHLKRVLWPRNASISVCWENPSADNKAMREVVQQAIRDTWEKKSGLKFTDWCSVTEKDADIHIWIEDDGPHTKGLGTDIKNKPKGMVLNFTFNNWSPSCQANKVFCIKAIAVHEFGHAIGFAHEQNRKDCQFDDCFGKEQGTDGDVSVTPCDIHSIMNYCNPRWSNDGLLSELDIKAVQLLYGLPENKMSEYKGLSIGYVSELIKKRKPGSKKISHRFKIYATGNQQDLEKVDSVVYHLHPTFKKPTMVSTNKASNFGIGLRVWGEFEITADIYSNGDKTPKTVKLDLLFNDDEGEDNLKLNG